MVKYIDQAGAQHFAEALMASTKTIGGQTIWGSGNIEAGGGTTTVTLTSAADFDTYKTVLESTDYKVVLFNFASVDLSSKIVTIENATLFSTYQARRGSIIKNGSIVFRDCRDGNSAAKPVTARYQGLLVAFQNTTKLQFINCHIVFGVDVTINGQGISTFADCTEVEIYQSYIESYEYDGNMPSTPAKLTLYDSTIKGFCFRSATALDLNSSSSSMNDHPFIANHVSRCNLGGVTEMTMYNNSANLVMTNTLFEGCVMPAMIASEVKGICNVLSCFTLSGSDIIFTAPGDIILASDEDFSNYSEVLKSSMPKNVYFIEPPGGFNLNSRTYKLNNCTLYTADYGADIHGYKKLDFINCKSGGNFGKSYITKFCKFYFYGTGSITFDDCDLNITHHGGYKCILASGSISIINTTLNGFTNSNTYTPLFEEVDGCWIEECSTINGFDIAPTSKTVMYLVMTEPLYNANNITFTNCCFGPNFTFYADVSTYLEATQFINCYFDMAGIPVNRGGLFNIQKCRVSNSVAQYCHPYILSSQPINNTAAGGFNTIV